MKRSMPFIILLLTVFIVSAQSNTANSLSNNLDALFHSYHYYNRFIGSVIISKNNTIIYQKSYGDANQELRLKNNENTVFSIASVSKPITAVAIMKLIEAGKLTLESKLSEFFPDFLKDYSNEITVRHLLNHSSGMQANIGRDDNSGFSLEPNENPIMFTELLNRFKDSKLKFEPGTHYEYNNFGYTLLAQIIEMVSGMSYDKYLNAVIFKPTHMEHTSAYSSKNGNTMAMPYIGLGMEAFTNFNAPIHPSWLKGAGAINSTTVDLHQFMIALDNETLLQRNNVDKLYSMTQSMEVNDRAYGLGWVVDQKQNEKWIYHDGLLPGYTSIIGRLPESGFKIVILSNATSTNPKDDFQGKDQFVDNEIIDKVIAVLKEQDIALLPLPYSNSNMKFRSNSKPFQLDNKHNFVIEHLNNEYWLETKGEEPWSVFTYVFAQDAKAKNVASDIGLYFAEAMKTQNLSNLVDYGNEEMKGFLGSKEGLDQLRGMWANMQQQAGDFKSYNIYNIKGDSTKEVYLRFHFQQQDVGLVLIINKDHKIQGMFMDDKMRTSKLTRVKLIPINNDEFFINGHKNGGFQDLRIKLDGDDALLIDPSKTFKAKLNIE